MRFSKLAFGAFAMAAAVLASPVAPAEVIQAAVGTVVTDKGITYEMKDMGQEIRAFDSKVDNGNFPRPVTYKINAGYTCRFYLEATRGVGLPIGKFTGSGDFGSDWVAFYACWHSWAGVSQHAPVSSGSDHSAIPCGFVGTEYGRTLSLSETGKRPHRLREFATNGEPYKPLTFHVTNDCNCRFYGATSRFGPELISEEHGVADGSFNGTTAARYECWIRSGWAQTLRQ